MTGAQLDGTLVDLGAEGFEDFSIAGGVRLVSKAIAHSSGSASRAPLAALTHWFIARILFEEFEEFTLCGYAYRDRCLKDGHPTMTSALVEMSSDDSWARTLNTIYLLSAPAAASSIEQSWRLRLPLLAMMYSGANLERLRGAEGGVEWPYRRSPAVKYCYLRLC